MKSITIPGLIALTFPSLVFAVANVFDAEALILSILGQLGFLFWIMAIVYFFYGLVKFISNSTDPTEREKGKSVMLWGLIAFTVLFSMWAIVRWILVDTLNITAAPINFIDKSGAVVP